MSTILEIIGREATDIEKEAAIAARAHFLSSRRWDKTSMKLGLPTALFAAIAGVTTISYDTNLGGVLSLIAAALSATSTFLTPSERATAHRNVGAAFNEIRRQANLLRDVDAQLIDRNNPQALIDLAERLKLLNQKLSETEQRAPTVANSDLDSARLANQT